MPTRLWGVISTSLSVTKECVHFFGHIFPVPIFTVFRIGSFSNFCFQLTLSLAAATTATHVVVLGKTRSTCVEVVAADAQVLAVLHYVVLAASKLPNHVAFTFLLNLDERG